jgi:hypothetical protein
VHTSIPQLAAMRALMRICAVCMVMAMVGLGCRSGPTPVKRCESQDETCALTFGAMVSADGLWRIQAAHHGCELEGTRWDVTRIRCSDTGETSLQDEEAYAFDLAQRIMQMKIYGGVERSALGEEPWFYIADQEFRISDAAWGGLFEELRKFVITKGVVARESVYHTAPRCERAEEVLVSFTPCDSSRPDAQSVSPAECGAPTMQCDAPRAVGESCTHHGACASGACEYPRGVCL